MEVNLRRVLPFYMFSQYLLPVSWNCLRAEADVPYREQAPMRVGNSKFGSVSGWPILPHRGLRKRQVYERADIPSRPEVNLSV